MNANSAFKNVDFDAPIIHNHDSEAECDTPKQTTSGDIPAYLNISQNIQEIAHELVPDVLTPIQVPI